MLTVLSPLGAVAEYTHQDGSFRAQSRVELSADFAGVTAYALDDYRVRHHFDDTNLQTVLKQEGYYHSLGVTLATSLRLGLGPFDWGGRAALDSWRGIEGFDEQQQTITKEISLADQRLDLRTWFGAKVPGTPFRFELLGRRRIRAGVVGDGRTKQGESSLYGTAGVVF